MPSAPRFWLFEISHYMFRISAFRYSFNLLKYIAPGFIAETKVTHSTNPLKKDEFETAGTNTINQIIIKTIFGITVAIKIDIETLNILYKLE